nr:unnamed protein product [Digitaria exilis]
MRTSNLAFAALLLLLLLATRAHGIRLDKQLHEAINSKQQMGDPKSGAGEASIAADSVKIRHCTPDGRCSGTTEQMTPTPVVAKDSEVGVTFDAAGKVERALAQADETAEAKHQQQEEVVISSTGNGHTATVDVRRGAEAARHSAAAASRRVGRQRRATFPDLMDIAGMDYSPAARKPPIHN